MISAALLVRYRQAAPVRYWKPIQTGIEQDNDTQTVVSLAGEGVRPPLDEGYRLPRPLSPHLSARHAGVSLSLETLAALAAAQPESDRFIVEGAGGVYVPLNESQFMLDVMQLFALPIVVVSRSTLGTINHTLLTLAALRARHLAVAGVIMNGPLNDDNRQAIETYGQVPVLAQVPAFDRVSRDTLVRIASLIDPQGRLLESALA